MIYERRLMIIFFILLAIIAITCQTLALTYPSYDTEQDCRGCHGITVERHHFLVPNSSLQCTDCHAMKFDSQNQTYYPEVIRNCLTCHPGKNHTDTHHLLVAHGLFVCTDCHPMIYDNQSQTYYPQITWDCSLCHSTVLSIQNVTPTPAPTPTPTPTLPVSPSITYFSPASPVKDIAGNSRNFGITTDQIVNITWFIEDTYVQFNESVMAASYTNTSSSPGVWDLVASATNANGSVSYSWVWNVMAESSPTTTIYPPDGQNSWYKTSTVYLNVADFDGIKYTNYSVDGGIWYSNPGSGLGLKTPVVLSDGTHSIQYYSVDNLGNTESTKTQSVKIDNTTPQITINSPVNGSKYVLNQNLVADWFASDVASGITTATGTCPSGSVIDTTSAGTKNFSVHATDNAGNTIIKNVTYFIHYNFGQFLQPIKTDGSSIFKLGSNVPIKFQLTDANGSYVTNAIVRLNISKITSTSTTGDVFIYETNGNKYSHNLGTKNMSIGTWRIRVYIDDGSSYAVNISLK